MQYATPSIEISYTNTFVVVGGGFEPPKAEPSDLQSDPFDHSGTPPLHFFGADTPNRTEDILITSEMLYQLSYIGIVPQMFCLAKDPGIITKHPTSGNPHKHQKKLI